MKKSDFKNGVQFVGKYSDNTIFKVCLSENSKFVNSYITSKLVMSNGIEIESNQYSLDKVTDKFIYLSDFVISKNITFRIPLQDIKIINL
jgi:hypothetical protein